MVLDPKHFDDIDDFCDFDDKLDASSEGDLGEGGPNHALSWRRIIIERAVNNVKKAQEQKVDVKAAHKKGSLVFDEKANRFGRVVESRPGFLSMAMLTGGSLVRQDLSPLDYVRKNRHQLTLPKIAEALFLTEVEVMILLNQVEMEIPETTKIEKIMVKPIKTKMVTKTIKTKVSPKARSNKKKAIVKIAAVEKPSIKITATKKSGSGKKTLKGKDAISFTKLLPKGATTDPIRDPNGYIQQNFLLMSNRELAHATGLSEHTIRRKLGEWNLKRKDFVNRA